MTDESAPPDDPPGVGIDRHHADEAIYEAFRPGPIPFTRGDDGLPTPSVQNAMPVVAPLTPRTMVCLGDTSEFVTRDKWGEIKERFRPEEVTRAPDGRYYVLAVDAAKKQWDGPLALPVTFTTDPNTVAVRHGNRRVEFQRGDPAIQEHTPEAPEPALDPPAPPTVPSEVYLERLYGERRIPVEPIRPACMHYRRQMTDLQDATDHQFIERLCTARRDSEGFFLSVRDQQVHACELREPRDPLTEHRLDRFDTAKLKLGAERFVEGGEFDIEETLKRTEEEANRGMRFGGIFADQEKSE